LFGTSKTVFYSVGGAAAAGKIGGMENTNYVSTRSQQEQAAAAISADVNNEGEYLVILVLGKRPNFCSSLLCLRR